MNLCLQLIFSWQLTSSQIRLFVQQKNDCTRHEHFPSSGVALVLTTVAKTGRRIAAASRSAALCLDRVATTRGAPGNS